MKGFTELDNIPLTEIEAMIRVIDDRMPFIASNDSLDVLRAVSLNRAELKSYMRKRVERLTGFKIP